METVLEESYGKNLESCDVEEIAKTAWGRVEVLDCIVASRGTQPASVD